MLVVNSLLLLLGLSAVIMNWQANQGEDLWIRSLAERSFSLLGNYGTGILGASLLANFLAGREQKF